VRGEEDYVWKYGRVGVWERTRDRSRIPLKFLKEIILTCYFLPVTFYSKEND